MQGVVSKLASTVSSKLPGSGHNSRGGSRQNSLGNRKSGTEMQDFEDTRTAPLANNSGSSDASYEGPISIAPHQ